MDIKDNWQMIQQFCRIAMKSSRHLSFASINSDGTPHITPIGSLILRNNCTGYYFEEYTKKMPANFAENPNVSILAVNSGFLFWIKSIFSGKFDCSPGIRLSGKVGERRMATENEISEWHDRMKRARKTNKD
jgi:uncharacterized pyridoxamine 5'-phosphate oxidase family protein